MFPLKTDKENDKESWIKRQRNTQKNLFEGIKDLSRMPEFETVDPRERK